MASDFGFNFLYSAQAPIVIPPDPNTSSPILKLLMFLPTDSTTPDNSIPGINLRGFLHPIIRRAGILVHIGNVRLRSSQSPMVTVAARTFTSTSLSPGIGFSTSVN
ncbi:MAG: hypothetical protein ABI663_20190 [Chryseolinea sp.]